MRPRLQWILAFSFVLLLPLAGGASPAEPNEPRLDPNVAPVSQAVTLSLDADKEDYSGSVAIVLRVQKPAREFLFHAEEMTLDRVELTGKAGAIPVEVTDGGDRGTRRATVSADLLPGEYTLTIAFSKPYNTNAVGLYRVVHEGRGYLFSQMQALDARKAFPCWDEPVYKIPFQITTTLPLQQVVVSNTPIEKETMGASTKTVQFKRTPPTSSYLLALAAGPLESVAIPGMSVPGRIYTAKGQKHMTKYAVSVAPRILKALEEYFGTKYPYEKLDLLALPEFWPGAMENPGAVTYRDVILLIDPAAASANQRRSAVYVTAHEFAHMWFGDLVTMSWWDDLWLNEAFADWLASKIVNDLYPEFDQETIDVQEVNTIMSGDAQAATTPVRKKVDTGADIMVDLGLAYEKGRTVLRMTEEYIGPDAFQRGVRTYLERHKWGNAVGADLFNALAEASGKDLEPILAGFLDQPGYPLVKIDVDATGMLTLSQKRFANHGSQPDAHLWTVPMRLKISDGKNVQARVVLLDEETKRVETMGKVDWVMPDEGGVGYYRWIVPSDMMMKIASNPTQTLSKRERSKFLGNTRALLNAGEIRGDEYLATAAAFAANPEPEVLASVMADLGTLKVPFVTEDLEDEFAAYVRRTLGPARERYGVAPRADDSEAVKIARPNLLSWLAGDGADAEAIAFAKQSAEAYMADASSVDAAIAGTVLGIAARYGSRAEYDLFRTKYEAATVPADRSRYLGALGKFREPALQDETLEYLLGDKVRPTDWWPVIGGLFETEQGREKVFGWLTRNYDRLAERMPGEWQSYFPYFVSGCSEERLAMAKKFFAEPAHRVDGTDANLAKVSEGVMDCVGLREREGETVAGYLRSLPTAP